VPPNGVATSNASTSAGQIRPVTSGLLNEVHHPPGMPVRGFVEDCKAHLEAGALAV